MNTDQTFLSTLVQDFPDVENTGHVSRAQIASTMEKLGVSKWPSWLMHHKVGRGLYVVPGRAETKETPKNVIVNMEDMSNLVPKVDANYVPFGNHKDIDTIIKSNQFYPAYISGPTGNGKSTTVEQACAKNKRSEEHTSELQSH